MYHHFREVVTECKGTVLVETVLNDKHYYLESSLWIMYQRINRTAIPQ